MEGEKETEIQLLKKEITGL